MHGTDPDSVSLVRPPNTTIPKTLAALPRSQYATTLSLVFGNNEDLVGFLAVSAFRLIDLLREESVDGPPKGDVSASLLEAMVRRVGDLKAFRNGVVGRPFNTECEHREQEKNSLESLGAALLSAGKALEIEAIRLCVQ